MKFNGPWRAKGARKVVDADGHDVALLCYALPGTADPAYVRGGSVHDLIAAAPELLEALRDCFPSLTCYCISSERPDVAPPKVCCLCRARALAQRIEAP